MTSYASFRYFLVQFGRFKSALISTYVQGFKKPEKKPENFSLLGKPEKKLEHFLLLKKKREKNREFFREKKTRNPRKKTRKKGLRRGT